MAEVHPTLEWRGNLPEIETARLRLRIIREDEGPKLARYLRRNRQHLQPWEPFRSEEYFTDDYWVGVPRWERQRALLGEAYRFRVVRHDDEREFVGVVALRDIVGDPNHSAVLGYSIDANHQGRGLATEAGTAALWFCFGHLNLRRIEACSMPANLASARVLTRLGFEREGLLRSSMRVNNQWEDHYVWSKINDNWRNT